MQGRTNLREGPRGPAKPREARRRPARSRETSRGFAEGPAGPRTLARGSAKPREARRGPARSCEASRGFAEGFAEGPAGPHAVARGSARLRRAPRVSVGTYEVWRRHTEHLQPPLTASARPGISVPVVSPMRGHGVSRRGDSVQVPAAQGSSAGEGPSGGARRSASMPQLRKGLRGPMRPCESSRGFAAQVPRGSAKLREASRAFAKGQMGGPSAAIESTDVEGGASVSRQVRTEATPEYG